MRKTKSEKFEPQIRFNWGYHDAAHTVQQGWDTREHFWGFAKAFGESIADPMAIAQEHQDPYYGAGWVAGYKAAKAGTYENNSAAAWAAFCSRDVRNIEPELTPEEITNREVAAWEKSVEENPPKRVF